MNFTSVSSSVIKNTRRVAQSPRSYTTATYTGSKIAWIYKPPGYDGNSLNYPLLIWFPGYGATDRSGGSFSNVNRGPTNSEGLGEVLLAGDNPPNILIAIPQNLIFGVDYGVNEWDAILTYMTANYRIDTNRQYLMGPSGGAIGCLAVLQGRSNVAAVMPISGPAFTNNWSSLSGIGFWQHQGTADGTFGTTIGGSLYNAGGTSGSAIDLTPAPRTTYYFGDPHSSLVWSNEVCYRLNRTDKAGTAKFDYPTWFTKFSKDPNQQAGLFVSNAENTRDIVDYRESLALVTNLPSGSLKDDLTNRLAALKLIVDKGGTRYIVSCNKTGVTVGQTGINDWNATFATGQGLSNIADDSGNSSTVGFVVTNQFASSSRDNAAGQFNAGRQKYKGIKLEYNLGGLVINHSITNGILTINNIPSGKLIDVLLDTFHIAGDDDNNPISASTAISATIDGITQTQYSAYNNAYYLQFTNIPESSGSVSIAMKTVSTRDVILLGFTILIHD